MPITQPIPRRIEEEGVYGYQYANIDAKLDKISDSVARIQAREEARDKAIHSLEHIVHGNGRPGIKADVDTLKIRLEKVDEDLRELKADVKEDIGEVRKSLDAGFAGINEAMESRKKLFWKIMFGIVTSGGGGAIALKIIEALAGA